MTDGPFNWIMLYFICFALGLALTALSFFTMHLHAGHFHFGRAHGVHAAHGHAGAHQHLSALNAFTLTGFLCWFGGAGFLLSRHSSFTAITVALLAALCGLGGAALLFAFLRLLNRYEKVLDPADTEITGMLGHLSQPITAGGIGEMLYLQNGARRSVPVRSQDGTAIPRNTEVVVMSFHRGVAEVRPWSAFESSLMQPEKTGAGHKLP